jgi:hypothetical protein
MVFPKLHNLTEILFFLNSSSIYVSQPVYNKLKKNLKTTVSIKYFLNYLDEIGGWNSVELEISGKPIHAASELNLGVDFVGISFALDTMFCPFQHR